MQRTITLQFLYKMMAMMMANWVDKNLGMHSWSIILVIIRSWSEMLIESWSDMICYSGIRFHILLYKIWISKKHLIDFLLIKDQFHNNMGPNHIKYFRCFHSCLKKQFSFFSVKLIPLKRLFEVWIFILGKHYFLFENVSYLLKIVWYDISIMLYVISIGVALRFEW